MKRRFPPDQLFAGFQKPLLRGLGRLSPLFPEIDAAWEASLPALVRRRDECDAVAGLALGRHRQSLAAGDFESFTTEMERLGQLLANRGVAEEHAFVALALYLEQCLPHFFRPKPSRPGDAVALARLVSVGQLFLHAGYANARAVGWRALDERDRRRLARDLHDEIGHGLILLKLYMEQLGGNLRRGEKAQAGRKLRETVALVSDAIESVRRVILDLGPAVIDELGLQQAIRLYARQFSARTGIKVNVREGSLPARLPQTHETALYRLLQGALSNVLEHSRAGKARVALLTAPGPAVVLVVEDDGVGFQAWRRAPARSFGLTTMRERMEALGGRVQVESWPKRGGKRRRGTRVEARLPLPPDYAA